MFKRIITNNKYIFKISVTTFNVVFHIELLNFIFYSDLVVINLLT